jgi:hypothetical protein
MGRNKPNRPRQSRKQLGAGGFNVAALEWLDRFPQDVNRALDNPDLLIGIMIHVGMEGPGLALRRVYEQSGREAFFEACAQKGLTLVQAAKMEGVITVILHLAKAVTPDREGEE